MSHSSIGRAANDPQLQERVKAAVYKVLYTDDEARTSIFGQAVLNNAISMGPTPQLSAMQWAVAVDQEAQYEYALANGNGSPGFDVSVIPDNVISAIVADVWPRTQPAAPPTPPIPATQD